ncbi:hypothetical protein BDB00DRAFT_837142, partial [Zychaea mexicana]|uniref:uncharacterized protein n=1 Tax=Zychaea mexicana TaxID=64656 RepID=UPI0022FE4047
MARTKNTKRKRSDRSKLSKASQLQSSNGFSDDITTLKKELKRKLSKSREELTGSSSPSGFQSPPHHIVAMAFSSGPINLGATDRPLDRVNAYAFVWNNNHFSMIHGSNFVCYPGPSPMELMGIKRLIESCPENFTATVVSTISWVTEFLKTPQKFSRFSSLGKEIHQLMTEKNITLDGAKMSTVKDTFIKKDLYQAAQMVARGLRMKCQEEGSLEPINADENPTRVQASGVVAQIQRDNSQQANLHSSDTRPQVAISHQLHQPSQQPSLHQPNTHPAPISDMQQVSPNVTMKSGLSTVIQATISANNSNISTTRDDEDIHEDAVDYTDWTDLERNKPQIRSLETMNQWITDLFRRP